MKVSDDFFVSNLFQIEISISKTFSDLSNRTNPFSVNDLCSIIPIRTISDISLGDQNPSI